jgi:hypothetical protein
MAIKIARYLHSLNSSALADLGPRGLLLNGGQSSQPRNLREHKTNCRERQLSSQTLLDEGLWVQGRTLCGGVLVPGHEVIHGLVPNGHAR